MIAGPLLLIILAFVAFIVYTIWMPRYHLKKFAYEGDKSKLALYLYYIAALSIIAFTIISLLWVGITYA